MSGLTSWPLVAKGLLERVAFPARSSRFRLLLLSLPDMTPWPLCRVINPNMTSGLSMGLAVTSQDAIDHEVHTMDPTIVYNGPLDLTVDYNDFLGVTVAYNHPWR